jgi:hypothetical protein
MSREVDRAALLAFVAKRRKSTGGYGATPRLPATIQDTFQALAIRLVLGCEPPSPATEPDLAEYLFRMLAVPWLGIGTTFRLLTACRLCGLAPDAGRLRSHLFACLDRDPSLATTYYASRIAREILGAGPADFLGPQRQAALPPRCAVQDAARYLAMAAMAGQRAGEAEELAGWLQRSQNGDGGFGFFPGTTSFIENCHAALVALSLLGAKPLDPGNARAFLVGCQTGAGGFARSPGVAPFLDASWHGVAGLWLLEEMARPAGVLSEAGDRQHDLVFSV